ncbi:MAG: Crp/Fnr family transcriptional regulator [Clostridia bacterium]|nr:Crp/Fnr family transcriptional regulator [Clostridia bacterium]
MKTLYAQIKYCPLFKDVDENKFITLMESIHYSVRAVKKNAVIANEEDDCTSIGIVLEGVIEVKKIYPSGKSITISQLGQGKTFGEVILFSNKNQYPSTIVASVDARILFMTKASFSKICHMETSIMINLLNILSQKILMLNNQLKNLSYESIRQKIANYLMQEYKAHKTDYITLSISRQQMAELLGIPRPSLSRELIHMKDDQIIDYHKNTFKILNLIELENALYLEN